MKIFAALCVERFQDRWNVEAEIISETREEVEKKIEIMLGRCVDWYDGSGTTRYEKLENSEYDYISYEKLEETSKEEIVYRYKIVEFNV